MISLCMFLWIAVIIEGSTGAEFWKQMNNITAVEGGTVMFRCKIPEGRGKVKRTWTNGTTVLFANSEKLPNDPRTYLITNSDKEYNFQVRSVSVRDEGRYTCTLYLDRVKEFSTYLTVNVPPRFTTDISPDISVDEGTNIILRCVATGKPEPTISWRHLVPSADGVRGTGSHLPISNIKRQSAGIYVCSADNKISVPITHRIKVTVRYPPEFDLRKGKKLTLKALGYEAILECAASAIPEPNFTWYHPNKNTYQTTKSSNRVRVYTVKRGHMVVSKLIISRVGPKDYGNFTCVAGNRLGFANRTLVLKMIKLAPTRPPPSKFFPAPQSGLQKRGGNSAVSSKLFFTPTSILSRTPIKILILLLNPIVCLKIVDMFHF